MALDPTGTRFLLHARRLGVSFAETATVGRQELQVNGDNLRSCLKHFGLQAADAETAAILKSTDGYSEALFKFLGARETVSFDASDYENATVVHDFNKPIPGEFKNRFTCVFDGGTLEHIFNFPTAIKNCMEMLKVGGHFVGITPTNNYSGHGFYQFSPELFFRIFVPANGFEVVKVYVVEEAARRRWYEVADPDKVNERVLVINDEPSHLLVVARKIAAADIFAVPPQQSDYLTMWSNGNSRYLNKYRDGRIVNVLKRVQKAAGRPLRMLSRRREHFKRVHENDL